MEFDAPSPSIGSARLPSSSMPPSSPGGGGGRPASTVNGDDVLDRMLRQGTSNLGSEMGRSDRRSPSADRDTAPRAQNRRPRRIDPADIAPVKDDTGERVRENFLDFLESYVEEPLSGSQDPDGDQQEPFYRDQVIALRDNGRTTLFVNFVHILRTQEVLARAISEQYYRFLPYLRLALRDMVGLYVPEYLYLNQHVATTASSGLLPRDFNVSFYNLALVSGIRDLRTDKVGRLVAINGTVTRTSEVRPELLSGAFTCTACNTTVRDVEQQFKYTEPIMCQNPQCNNTRSWQLNVEQSRFCDWQKVRIQENANEIPTGSMPRSLDVILRSEIVEHAKAGDKCIFTGTFVVVPDVSQLGVPGVNAQIMREASGGRSREGGSQQGVSGLKSLGVRDLTYKTAFLACMVQNADSRPGGDIRGGDNADGVDDPEELMDALTEAERDELEAMVTSDNIYNRLVQSIAPTVYGHDIVKKGILLQLMGGVHKQTQEGIHLRGDLNVCIVGDPSTSKSQFLKYVCGFLPRAVYTSGKASSAAGLTAAVVKDEETGEFTIEAGALMLADNGICAIDEFDKMDISDQVAIHEAMEQQTISIAKAGVQATLNARTSILAAANPVGGRYNRKQTLRANVAMSAPIMSRFDLFFVILDECNENVDMNIAQHIVNVHRFRDDALDPEFSTEAIQRYIRYARTFQPKLTPEAGDLLVEKYRQLRSDDAGVNNNSYRITVRQLESLIRLSEAIARANCRPDITPAFVREAYALLRQSIIHVEKDDIEMDDDDEDEDDDAFGGAGAGVNRRRTVPSATPDADMIDEEDFNAVESAERDFAERNASTAPPPTAPPAPTTVAPKKRMRITHERYMEMMMMIVNKLNLEERENHTGMRREDLEQWYLNEKEDGLETVAQLDEETDLVRKVITKLIKDQYLIELQSGDDEGESQDAAGESMESNSTPASGVTILVVHPRVDLDTLADAVRS